MLNVTKVIIIFVLATFVTADTNAGLCKKYEDAMYTGRRLKGAVFREIRNTTKRQCEIDCHVRTLCRSINYNQLELSCQLNWNAVNKSDLLDHSRHWEYVHKQTLLQAYGVGCPNAPCPPNSMCVSLASRLKTCVAIDCGIAPEGINAKPLLSRTTTMGHPVRYQCPSNFYFVNDIDSRMCMANGQLSGEDIICIRFRCTKPYTGGSVRSHTITCYANGKCAVTYVCYSGRKTKIGCSTSGQYSTQTIYC